MMLIFEIRAKLTEIYQKHDFVIKTALKFLLMFLVLSRAAKFIGYNGTLSKSLVIIVMSVFCAFMPSALMVFAAVAYVFIQLMTASILLAVTVVLIFLIMYLFFLRFTPKEGIGVLATPLLCSMGFPYLIPLFLGMFGSVLSVIPAACGVMAYYLLSVVRDNIITLDQLKQAKDEALPMYMNVLDNLLKNPKMYVMMAVFAIVIITMVVVRSLQMDYAFEISLAVGTGVMIIGFIVCSLKYELDMPVVKVIFGSLICMAIVLICLFFYRVLNYSAAEHVQFEDEHYYYYVRAVPKITAKSPKKAIRKVMTSHKGSSANAVEEESEEEALEAMESMLARKDSANSEQLTPGLAKRLRRDVAPKQEPRYEDEDEEDDDEIVIKGPKEAEGSFTDSVKKLWKSGSGKVKALFAKKGDKAERKPRKAVEDDEDEDDGEGEEFFPEKAKAVRPSATGRKSGEKEEDYE